MKIIKKIKKGEIMKILFGADVSFNYIEGLVTRERAYNAQQGVPQYATPYCSL